MKKILHLFLSLTFFSSFAQSEFTLGMMEHVYQSSYINMTAKPSHKVSIGLPGMSSIYAGFAFTGLKVEDLYKVLPNGETRWDVANIKSKLTSNTMVFGSASTDIFHFRLKARNTFLSFHIRSVLSSYLGLPSALGLAITGENVDENNKPKNWDLAGLSADVTHYNEYAFGLSTTLKKFSYGFRVKFLQGLSNISTESDNPSINFNDQFHVRGGGFIRANISSPADTSNSVPSSYRAQDYFTNFDNKGFATDLSLAYKFNQKLTFALSVNDIGFISWSTNGRTEEINANVSFTGIKSIDPLLSGQNIDSLKYKLDFNAVRGKIDSYSKFLIPNLYFIAKYDITPRWSVSATMFAQKYHAIRLGIAAGTQLKLGNLLSLAGNIKYQYSAVNLGFGLVVKPGPFQFYIATDNIPLSIQTFKDENTGSTVAYAPLSTNQFNIRTGINLVFGKERVPQAQPVSY